MKKDYPIFLKLFLSTFSLSLFTFGGGYVMVTLMKKKFVDEFHWIEEKEMLDIIAIAQSSPGVIAVNSSILIGYKVAGIAGAMTTVLGTVLPPLLVITGVSYIYDLFKESTVIADVMLGLRAGIAAVMVDVVIRLFMNIKKEKSIFMLAVMVASFIASFLFELDVVIIILVCGALGLLSAYPDKIFRRRR
ncbi:MAG: chromate transporter [Saccharofermentanales bacterium]